MTETNTKGLEQNGIIVCPFCGHEGENFNITKNLTGQEIFVCPSCDKGI